MSWWEEEEYIAGLHGLMQTLVRASRLDKKMQKDDYSRVFGDELGRWMVHVNVRPDDHRLYILSRWVAGETVKAWLRGSYNGKLVIPPNAKVIMMELGVKNRFDFLNLPKAVGLEEKILKSLTRKVERG
ncbi:MAG: hypothetical protein QXZ63_06730 [Sulfolobales archaeon]